MTEEDSQLNQPYHPGGEPSAQSGRGDRPKRRLGRGRRIILGLIWLLILASIAYAVVIITNVAKISDHPYDLVGLAGDTSGRVNILVLGQGDPGHAGAGLTDTMMVISLNPATRQVAEISVPRDLEVSVPGYGKGKINVANADGGPTLAEQTVANTLGIPINYYISTDFSGLQGIVDAVGGLDINVKTALIDTEYPCDDNQYKVCGLNIQPGLQHMDGAKVLQYTRCRKGTCGNDFGRAARQQEVLTLLRQKVVQPGTLLNPLRLGGVTSALRTTLTTDMSGLALVQFGYDWWHSGSNPPIQLVLSTSPGGYLVSGASGYLIPADGTFEAISQRVQTIFDNPPAASPAP